MGSTIWQSQLTESPRVSLELIQFHAGKKQRSLSNERNIFYLVAAGVFTTWGISAFKRGFVIDGGSMDTVFGVVALLFSLAVMGMVIYIHRHIRIKKLDIDAGVVNGLELYRSELERLLQSARREWHLLLYVAPSYLTLLIGGLIFDQRPGKVWRYGLTTMVGVIGVGLAFWAGRKKVRCLQRELDAIASLK